MKKLIFTHLFLNLYLLALIQPIIPIIEYFVNYDYIASELCENKNKPILTCNGKCYLEEQVVQQLDINNSQEVPMPPKVDLEKFITIKTKPFVYKFLDSSKLLKKLIFLNTLKDNFILITLFKPPKI